MILWERYSNLHQTKDIKHIFYQKLEGKCNAVAKNKILVMRTKPAFVPASTHNVVHMRLLCLRSNLMECGRTTEADMCLLLVTAMPPLSHPHRMKPRLSKAVSIKARVQFCNLIEVFLSCTPKATRLVKRKLAITLMTSCEIRSQRLIWNKSVRS